MLSPEERNLLENAKALISEIESMQEGEETGEEEYNIEMQNGEKKDGEKPDDYKEDKDARRYKKSSEGTGVNKQESDGSTASDTADEIVEDLPAQTEENVDEVAKSIVQLLTKNAVQKSVKPKEKVVQSDNKAVVVALNALTGVVKSLAENQNEQEQALSTILEANGIVDAIRVEKSANQAPVVNADLAQVLTEVNKSLKSLNQQGAVAPPPEQKNDITSVRKALKKNMPALLGV